MNILFIDFALSQKTKGFLTSLGLTTEHWKTVTDHRNILNKDFIICHCRTLDTLHELTTRLQSNVSSLVVLFLDSRLIRSTKTVPVLSTLPFTPLVLDRSHAEHFLLHNLKFLLQNRRNQHQLQVFETQFNNLARQTSELSEKTQILLNQFEQDMGLAENIQKSLSPQVSPAIPGISLAVKYLPASGLGGDYYDIFELEDRRRFGLLVADSTSHGVAAALLSVLLKLRVEELKDRFPTSGSLVTHLSDEIRKIRSCNHTDLHLLYGILDRTNLSFQFTTAGPISPFLWRNSRLVSFDSVREPSLGDKADYSYHHLDLQLLPGDLLLFNTNGLEAPFKDQGLSLADGIKKAFSGVKGDNPVLFQNELLACIGRFKETKIELPDDITLIQLAINQKAMYLAQSK